ncbi:tRNA (guanine(26)-N(2))-dimethyltransferase [Astathelohania contejeani]|uniref:tRNA (guanine(26)-N(2))-dimethyltransferase n=1 Tax=Astathelohania contejeani TaxID=164912 RepID=A0ABQ7I0A4_9MICR|nr:tRNA (guanine(26)-N(2))-dimethyltransferase [Thelohania contejeani]
MEETQMITENNIKIFKMPNVFYNPAQKLNRDLSIAVINEFIKDIKEPKIFEAMSATGLRGIRYKKELINDAKIYLNDLDSESIKLIEKNIILNELNPTDFYITNEDCNKYMASNPSTFDVIDIDPFGCCTPFINTALLAIKNNGLLCLTSTDMGVLCNNKAKCYLKYGSAIYKTPACHELAIRTLLSCLSREASKYNICIDPLISVSVDFYIRIFVKVTKKISKALTVSLTNSNYLFCGCFNIKEIKILTKFDKIKNTYLEVQKCDICNKKFAFCGPFWNKAIHNGTFASSLNKSLEKSDDLRLIGILRLIEFELNEFLYYCIPSISSYKKLPCIPMDKLLNALFNLGYDVSFTHCKFNSIKTNAPLKILYEIIEHFHGKNNETIYSFKENSKTLEMLSRNYYRKLCHSSMGPLSKPQHI